MAVTPRNAESSKQDLLRMNAKSSSSEISKSSAIEVRVSPSTKRWPENCQTY